MKEAGKTYLIFLSLCMTIDYGKPKTFLIETEKNDNEKFKIDESPEDYAHHESLDDEGKIIQLSIVKAQTSLIPDKKWLGLKALLLLWGNWG